MMTLTDVGAGPAPSCRAPFAVSPVSVGAVDGAPAAPPAPSPALSRCRASQFALSISSAFSPISFSTTAACCSRFVLGEQKKTHTRADAAAASVRIADDGDALAAGEGSTGAPAVFLGAPERVVRLCELSPLARSLALVAH